MILWLMAEGVDISVMVRYTGHADSTITRWLQRMGSHSILLLTFVQLDELHAKVRTGVQWLWLAIDPVTKIIPSLHLGGRKQEDAYVLLHDLHLRLDDDCVPAFTSAGLRSYFYAITAHFGDWFRPEQARTTHRTHRLCLGCRALARPLAAHLRSTGQSYRQTESHHGCGSQTAHGDLAGCAAKIKDIG
jgi:transposase-like protein